MANKALTTNALERTDGEIVNCVNQKIFQSAVNNLSRTLLWLNANLYSKELVKEWIMKSFWGAAKFYSCGLCFSSTLQEQKGELRKRLSYTTHKLEMLETEFDSTRQYLEIELRRAQEELEKVTEKLRRLVTNFLK